MSIQRGIPELGMPGAVNRNSRGSHSPSRKRVINVMLGRESVAPLEPNGHSTLVYAVGSVGPVPRATRISSPVPVIVHSSQSTHTVVAPTNLVDPVRHSTGRFPVPPEGHTRDLNTAAVNGAPIAVGVVELVGEGLS